MGGSKKRRGRQKRQKGQRRRKGLPAPFDPFDVFDVLDASYLFNASIIAFFTTFPSRAMARSITTNSIR